jgi:hypothetical protein
MQLSTFIIPFWFIFMSVFFYLAFAHWRESSNSIRPFQVRRTEKSEEEDTTLNEMDLKLADFLHNFNDYLDGVNSDNKTRNLISAGSYFFAGVVALVSLFVLI